MTKEVGAKNVKIDIDFKVLDALMQFKVTKGFVADYMGVSEDTIDRRIRESSGLTFTAYGKLKQQRTGLKLQQKCIELALGGDRTLMIFALKNMADWTDKIDSNVDVSGITIKIDSDDSKL